MLIEPPLRVILLPSDQESQPVFSGGHEDAERYKCHQPIRLWDEVAERWPNGGRFPSFIIADQSA